MEEDQTWDHHFCDGIFQCNTIVVYGKILIPKKQSVLDILIMAGLSIWTKMGSIQDMAWNCWIRSLSIPDGSTNMCMTHGTMS